MIRVGEKVWSGGGLPPFAVGSLEAGTDKGETGWHLPLCLVGGCGGVASLVLCCFLRFVLSCVAFFASLSCVVFVLSLSLSSLVVALGLSRCSFGASWGSLGFFCDLLEPLGNLLGPLGNFLGPL